MSRRPGRGVGTGSWMATAGLLLLGFTTGDARAQTLEVRGWRGAGGGGAPGRAARDPTETRGVREAAVFALAQRPPEEGVPMLMDLAETAPDADTRRSAFFRLAQSDDPRVPGFFARILAGPA